MVLYNPARTAIILKETKEQPKVEVVTETVEAPAAQEETVNPNEAPAETAAPAAEAPKKTTRKRTTKKAAEAPAEE